MNDDNAPSAAALLDRIDLLSRDDSQIVQTISSILSAPDYHELFSSFQADATQQRAPERATKFVNALDKALAFDDGLPDTKSKFHRALRKTCAEAGILPSSYYLDDGQMKKVNDVPFASGGYSDVWRGLYKGENVSIKAFRVYMTDNIKQLTKAWCKEIVVCRNLSHPNILSFLGVISTDSLPLCIVSKWMKNGNISEFLRRDGQFNRRPLLIDIARGLNYLHSQHVVHGDLKGPNILIDDNHNAVLCDFGLASITADAESAHASTVNSAGSIRWMAPERLSIFDGTSEPAPNSVRVTKESDMYSLAMVVIEVFTGTPPFSETADAGVILKLAQQKRPKKPEGAVQLGLTNPIWETVETCWKTRPSDRRTAAQVLEIWEKEINPANAEDGERKRSRTLSAFSAGKNSSWLRFVCGGFKAQYVQ